MDSFAFGVRGGIAALLAWLLASRGLKKKSLSVSGATAAAAVGFLSFLSGYRFGVVLILFYQSSSSLTKLKSSYKKSLEADHKEGGQRDHMQVLSCSLIATLIAVAFMWLEGDDSLIDFPSFPRRSYLLCAFVGHYACCNGDTWASELGVLDPWLPLLVTQPWRTVPKGTNGGMSVVGTLASLGAGVFIGLGFYGMGSLTATSDPGLQPPPQYPVIILGGLAGFFGSLLDSIMGATLQATYFDKDRKVIVKSPQQGSNVERVCGVNLLSNEMVNAISVLLTTLAAAALGPAVMAMG